MIEIDPYVALGVPRTATHAEIARAYRALARLHHPDVGAEPSPTMSVINEAWHILRDPGRRAVWDRQHRIVERAAWAPSTVDEPVRRPVKEEAPPSRMDSPWPVIGILAGIALLVGVLMAGVSLASAPPDDTVAFTSDELELRYPAGWSVAEGVDGQSDEHRVIAHFVSFPPESGELCNAWGEACTLEAAEIPAGEASVLVIERSGGTPPIPDPVTRRPYGLDADAIIGGQPAAMERHTLGNDATEVWWQLSPPGFPDRWIEVHAVVAGLRMEQDEVLSEIEEMLETLEFRNG